MPHDMPQDWNVIDSSVALIFISLVAMLPLLFWVFRGLEPKNGDRQAVGVIVSGVILFVGCPLLYFALASVISGLSFAWVEFQMHRDGRVTDTGVVRERVNRTTINGETGATTVHHWLLIEFRDHQGQIHQVEREVDKDSWIQHDRGSRLSEIQYRDSMPTTWRFAAESGLWWRLLVRGGICASLVFAMSALGRIGLRLTRRGEPRALAPIS
jgi:hypothetical protein